VWDDYVKSKGTLKGKQARELVYESLLLRRPLLIDKRSSRTVAEAWVVLQVEFRFQLGVNVDYKAAQREGEWRSEHSSDLIVTCPVPLLLFFYSETRRPGCP
jgi:hypothetical protein